MQIAWFESFLRSIRQKTFPILKRSRFLIHALILISAAACSVDSSDMAAQTGSTEIEVWSVNLHMSGGFAGQDCLISLDSGGLLTNLDQISGESTSRQLPAEDLAYVAGLVAQLDAQPDNGTLPDCADCFLYEVTVLRNELVIEARLNDVNLASSSFQPLIDALLSLMAEASG